MIRNVSDRLVEKI